MARDLLQGFRQPVVHALARRLVGGDDRVHEPHRVAHGNRGAEAQGGEKGGKVEAVEIGCHRRRAQAGKVAPDRIREGGPEHPPERIEDCPVEEGRPVRGDERG
jgi:hypothetical protein